MLISNAIPPIVGKLPRNVSTAQVAPETSNFLPQDARVVNQAITQALKLDGAALKAQPEPAPPEQPPAIPQKKWTVLLYSAADNNLYKYMYDDVAEMEKVGSDAQTNLAVQIDHGRPGAQRLLLQKDPARVGPHGNIDSPVLEDLGQVNMSDSKTLSEAIQWAVNKFPAEHYALVISDHGDAWNGCVEDDSANDWMKLPALKAGLQDAQAATGKKLDILGFDACLMANTEVAYEVKDLAKYLVASEQTEGGDGWPYAPILTPTVLAEVQRRMTDRIDMEPVDLAKLIVAKAQDDQHVLRTMSAIDLSKVDALQASVAGLKDAIVNSHTPGSVLGDIRDNTTSFSGYKDLGHFTGQIVEDGRITDDNLKARAAQVRSDLGLAVIAEQHVASYPNASGLTIELNGTNSDDYNNTDFQQVVDWNAAVHKMNE